MKILLGTVAHNQHVAQIARSLHEADALGAFYTGGVDVWKSGVAGRVRRYFGPELDQKLERRRVSDVPESLVFPHWGWETARLLARMLGSDVAQDWCWERSEMELDRTCARVIDLPEFGGFIGTEFGCLATLNRTHDVHKPAAVIFLSPHHRTRAMWVDREYERFPPLLSRATKKLLDLGAARDARRDQEAMMSDLLVVASSFTANSLIAAGVSSDKIITVPLGCPEVCGPVETQSPRGAVLKFMYSGPVSVRKGAHYLLRAWKRLAIRRGAELHFYGTVQLPPTMIDHSDSIYFHGNVSPTELAKAYDQADFLIFPTLCDGFGLVVGEALSHSVPVLTTTNAGAADLIRPYRNGLIVPPADTEALAAGMQWILENRRLLPLFREESRNTARDWTWRHFRQAFLREIPGAFPNLIQVTSPAG